MHELSAAIRHTCERKVVLQGVDVLDIADRAAKFLHHLRYAFVTFSASAGGPFESKAGAYL